MKKKAQRGARTRNLLMISINKSQMLYRLSQPGAFYDRVLSWFIILIFTILKQILQLQKNFLNSLNIFKITSQNQDYCIIHTHNILNSLWRQLQCFISNLYIYLFMLRSIHIQLDVSRCLQARSQYKRTFPCELGLRFLRFFKKFQVYHLFREFEYYFD